MKKLKLGSRRKLLVFACRCVRETPLADGRKVWDLLTDERSRNAVEVAERFARGKATRDELDSARAAAWDVVRRSGMWDPARDATRSAWSVTHPYARIAAKDAAAYAADTAWQAAEDMGRKAAWHAAAKAQADMLREIYGDPFAEHENPRTRGTVIFAQEIAMSWKVVRDRLLKLFAQEHFNDAAWSAIQMSQAMESWGWREPDCVEAADGILRLQWQYLDKTPCSEFVSSPSGWHYRRCDRKDATATAEPAAANHMRPRPQAIGYPASS
jgi:hypothetical protein